jgi:hypothetical protein
MTASVGGKCLASATPRPERGQTEVKVNKFYSKASSYSKAGNYSIADFDFEGVSVSELNRVFKIIKFQ